MEATVLTRAAKGSPLTHNEMDANLLSLKQVADYGASGTYVGLSIAAISATLPALSFVDMCLHLARNDSDFGAWRMRKGQTWRSETRSMGQYLGSFSSLGTAVAAGGVGGDYFYNEGLAGFREITADGAGQTATVRGGKEDYPTNALITAESGRIIIWDLDGVQPSMWAVGTASVGGVTSVAALGSSIVIGGTASQLQRFDLLSGWYQWAAAGARRWTGGTISDRGTALAFDTTKTIPSATVNDVAITVLPDAPIDEYGMPIPTIAVATAAGVSVVKQDGAVASVVPSVASCAFVIFDGLYNIWTGHNSYGRHVKIPAPSYSSQTLVFNTNSVPANPNQRNNSIFLGGVLASYGSTFPLSLNYVNDATPARSLMAYITTTYNTGWMVGDIRRAVGYDSASALADKSIKAGAVSEVGTLTKTPVAGGLTAVSGFSNANYIEMATSADFNALGTADSFPIHLPHAKWGTTATLKCLASFGDGVSAGSFELQHLAANTLSLVIHDGASLSTICTSTIAFTDTVEHDVKVYRRSGTWYIDVDGAVVASAASALTISNATGVYRIGEAQAASRPWAGGQFSGYARISATAPTAEQSKFIAATENALNGGLACLLSNSDTVSALNWNNEQKVLHVGNGTNIDEFVVLLRIASYAHGAGTLKTVVGESAFFALGGTAGGSVGVAERDVASEIEKSRAKTVRYATLEFVASGTTKVLDGVNAGWKARGRVFNTTDSNSISLSQTFDGQIWTITGLTSGKSYYVELER